MRDNECVAFLQWALPALRMRWTGFRKVRRQVCKRIQSRIKGLGLVGEADYRDYLGQHDTEWHTLDSLCRVSISRFYRDKQVFAFLEQEVMPMLAQQACEREEKTLRVWSIGCSSGEEPYTVALLWHLALQSRFPTMDIHILATDADPHLIWRAKTASYPYGSIKNLPAPWREMAFQPSGESFSLQPVYQQDIHFAVEDVRERVPDESFHLVFCRNLVFTYYDESLQRQRLERIKNVLVKDGALVLGVHETLPEGCSGFTAWSERLRIYRKID